MVRAPDSQLDGCEFDSRPPQCQVTSCSHPFGSAGHSGLLIACLAAVTGRGQLYLLRQPLRYTASGMGCAPFLQCLGRLSLPCSMGW